MSVIDEAPAESIGTTSYMLSHEEEWPGVQAWLADQLNGIERFTRLVSEQDMSERKALEYILALTRIEDYTEKLSFLGKLGLR